MVVDVGQMLFVWVVLLRNWWCLMLVFRLVWLKVQCRLNEVMVDGQLVVECEWLRWLVCVCVLGVDLLVYGFIVWIDLQVLFLLYRVLSSWVQSFSVLCWLLNVGGCQNVFSVLNIELFGVLIVVLLILVVVWCVSWKLVEVIMFYLCEQLVMVLCMLQC